MLKIAPTANPDEYNRNKSAKAVLNALIEKPILLNSIKDISIELVAKNKIIPGLPILTHGLAILSFYPFVKSIIDGSGIGGFNAMRKHHKFFAGK